jgi:hypothetical protein
MEINIKSGGYKKMNKLDKNIRYPHCRRNIFIIENESPIFDVNPEMANS